MFGGGPPADVRSCRQTKFKTTGKKAQLQHTAHDLIAPFKNLLQTELFPWLESTLGPLSKQSKLLAAVLSLEPLARHVQSRRSPTGRRPSHRLRLATAFCAKAIYNLPTTRHLMQRLQTDTQLRRLCGWDQAAQVPAEATFSRAFAEFAATGLPAQIHAALVRKTQQQHVMEHIARDSTAIHARQRLPEEPAKKAPATTEKPPAHAPYKTATGWHQRGQRGKKHQQKRTSAKQRGPRLQRQQHMNLAEMLADLPQECSLGAKKNSQGHSQYWRGYKLHWDVADGRIPISCILTGAAVHDSQVAIPLMQMSAERVRWKCDLMDSAYDAKLIRARSQKLGHEALIKPNPSHARSAQENAFTEPQKQRFKKRTIVEQLNGRLKDEFGGRTIYVKGASKIMAHLMFGVIALTVDQLLRLAT
jgi:transposase